MELQYMRMITTTEWTGKVPKSLKRNPDKNSGGNSHTEGSKQATWTVV